MPDQDRYHIAEFSGWSVTHRSNSAMPGYLIISATKATNELSDLPSEELSLLGSVLASVQRALNGLGAKRAYIGRYGHSQGHPIHFHAIPIYDWVESLFWKDDRYRLLNKFAHGPGETPTDGAELTLLVSRESCESADPPPIEGPSIAATITILRRTLQLRLE